MTDHSAAIARVPALLGQLYEVVAEFEAIFPDRKFTPDGHLVGSLGESIAAHAFDLDLETPSTEGFDARTPEGLTVEIKATQGTSVGLRIREELLADRLIVLRIGRDGDVEIAYNGPAQPAWDASGKPQENGQRGIALSTLRALQASVGGDLRIPIVRPL